MDAQPTYYGSTTCTTPQNQNATRPLFCFKWCLVEPLLLSFDEMKPSRSEEPSPQKRLSVVSSGLKVFRGDVPAGLQGAQQTYTDSSAAEERACTAAQPRKLLCRLVRRSTCPRIIPARRCVCVCVCVVVGHGRGSARRKGGGLGVGEGAVQDVGCGAVGSRTPHPAAASSVCRRPVGLRRVRRHTMQRARLAAHSTPRARTCNA